MLNKNNTVKISTGLLMVMLLAIPQLSYADWGFGVSVGSRDNHRFYRYHDHPRYGLRMHYLPHGYFTLRVRGARYYYYDGLYYSYVGGGNYVLISPPVGAVVTTIPSDFQPVLINGVTYYMNNGIYYLYTRQGYQVVAQPVTVVVTQAPAVVVPAPVASQDSFTVNVPNNSGGYTTVLIKKSGNGFIGPQGEFYAAFPAVAQLKVMYGK